MVQELHVLRCFSCDTFQSHIVKKTNKWECKICGMKQSVKKVYGRGSGKDCRIHTQKLNALNGQKQETENSAEQAEEINVPQRSMINEPSSFASPKNEAKRTTSKWAEFVDENETAVYQNNFTKQENISFTPSETFQSKEQKRKASDAFDDEEFGGYFEDFDSVDSNYSTFSHMGPSGHTKKIKCNKYHTAESNISNKNISSGNYNKQGILKTPKNSTQFKSRPNIESENETKGLEIPSVNNKNKQQSNTKVGLKWRKYLDEEENVISTGMPLVKALTSDQSGSEIDLKRVKYHKNNSQEEEVSCFQDSKFFGNFVSKDCNKVPSNDIREVVSSDFERISSDHFVTNSETVENITPNVCFIEGSVNHSVNTLKNSSRNNANSVFFDSNHEPTDTSSDKTLKHKFSMEDDNNSELSKRLREQFDSETVLSLPFFEQNCELSDSDFQLDF